ncbi:YggT family protein [Alkalicoccobacillus plakortidis]|uniref:YggT family protein n=1 Tax=Alkalicoccobacillus plakortidis TaxID=444060 RepID=A0ABT0XFZ2_9BACI|nr:YggT family protein [Alkalicoccobacillus plakortidis]MCM2674807.1 YggT family protein [Alkalicoccobacillus plakortidis]
MAIVINLVQNVIMIYTLLIFAWVLMSWFPNARESGIGQMIGRIVEPYIDLFRQFIPRLGMIDLSPLVALLVMRFAGDGLIFLLTRLA